jgi:hypothetical protein
LLASSSDTFCDWIVSAAWRSFCALRCEQLDGLVRERHHTADEPVHEVVRQEPREAFPEDRQPALVTLQCERQRDEPHVDGEVRGAREQTET